MPEKARVKYKTHLHGSLVVSGNCIPRHDRLPPYKSWSYLMQNELANEVGGRIFYTDATGLMLFSLLLVCTCWHTQGQTPSQVFTGPFRSQVITAITLLCHFHLHPIPSAVPLAIR